MEISQEHILTNIKLKKFFPQYKKEIEQAQREMACGCSCCVWWRLSSIHPEIELPATDKVFICV